MIAEREDLDLIEMDYGDGIPVCIIENYSKFTFRIIKKEKKAKKNQKKSETREIKFTPCTGLNDMRVKQNKINEFLGNGDKVKVTVRFRGRESKNLDLGKRIFDQVKVDLLEGTHIEEIKSTDSKSQSIIVSMNKKRKN